MNEISKRTSDPSNAIARSQQANRTQNQAIDQAYSSSSIGSNGSRKNHMAEKQKRDDKPQQLLSAVPQRSAISDSRGQDSMFLSMSSVDDMSDLDFSTSRLDERDLSGNPMQSMPQDKLLLLENEALRKQLREMKMDRDHLQRQLTETRDELSTTRSDLQGRIKILQKDYENAIIQQNRQLEQVSNSILEEELEELQHIQKEVEENSPLEPNQEMQKRIYELQEEVSGLQNQVDTFVEREAHLQQELQEARDEAESTAEALKEAKRRIRWSEQELSDSELSYSDFEDEAKEGEKEEPPHVSLLHHQRQELQRRVRQLLSERSQLRKERTALHHENVQYARKTEALEKDLKDLEQDKSIDELMLHRQLTEWKQRSATFEKELRLTKRDLAQQTRTYSGDRLELARRLEVLETENKELIDRQMKNHAQWEHERSLHKRELRAVETKLAEKAKTEKEIKQELLEQLRGEERDGPEEAYVPPTPPPTVASDGRIDHQSAMPVEYQTDLEDRLKYYQEELEAIEKREAFLKAQLAQITEVADSAQTEAAEAKSRMEVLEAYLDVSMTSSLSSTKKSPELITNKKSPGRENEKHQVGNEMDRNGDEILGTSMQHDDSSPWKDKGEKQPTTEELNVPSLKQKLSDEKRRLADRQRARIDRMKELDRTLSASQSQLEPVMSPHRRDFQRDQLTESTPNTKIVPENVSPAKLSWTQISSKPGVVREAVDQATSSDRTTNGDVRDTSSMWSTEASAAGLTNDLNQEVGTNTNGDEDKTVVANEGEQNPINRSLTFSTQEGGNKKDDSVVTIVDLRDTECQGEEDPCDVYLDGEGDGSKNPSESIREPQHAPFATGSVELMESALENELLKLQSMYDDVYFQGAEREKALKSQRLQLDEAFSRYNQVVEHVGTLQGQVTLLTEKNEALQNTLSSAENGDGLQFESRSNSSVMTSDELKESQEKCDALKQQISKLKTLYDSLALESDNHDLVLDSAKLELGEAKSMYRDVLKENQRLSDEVQRLEKENRELRNQVDAMERQLKQEEEQEVMKSKIQRSSISMVSTELSAASARCSALEQELEEAEDTNERLSVEADALQEKLDLAQRKLAETLSINANTEDSKRVLEMEVAKLTKQNQDMHDELKAVEGERKQEGEEVRLESRGIFDSGDFRVESSGEKVVHELSDKLRDYEERERSLKSDLLSAIEECEQIRISGEKAEHDYQESISRLERVVAEKEQEKNEAQEALATSMQEAVVANGECQRLSQEMEKLQPKLYEVSMELAASVNRENSLCMDLEDREESLKRIKAEKFELQRKLDDNRDSTNGSSTSERPFDASQVVQESSLEAYCLELERKVQELDKQCKASALDAEEHKRLLKSNLREFNLTCELHKSAVEEQTILARDKAKLKKKHVEMAEQAEHEEKKLESCRAQIVEFEKLLKSSRDEVDSNAVELRQLQERIATLTKEKEVLEREGLLLSSRCDEQEMELTSKSSEIEGMKQAISFYQQELDDSEEQGEEQKAKYNKLQVRLEAAQNESSNLRSKNQDLQRKLNDQALLLSSSHSSYNTADDSEVEMNSVSTTSSDEWEIPDIAKIMKEGLPQEPKILTLPTVNNGQKVQWSLPVVENCESIHQKQDAGLERIVHDPHASRTSSESNKIDTDNLSEEARSNDIWIPPKLDLSLPNELTELEDSECLFTSQEETMNKVSFMETGSNSIASIVSPKMKKQVLRKSLILMKQDDLEALQHKEENDDDDDDVSDDDTSKLRDVIWVPPELDLEGEGGNGSTEDGVTVDGLSAPIGVSDYQTLSENGNELLAIFKQLDSNGNGELDLLEFEAGFDLLNEKLPESSRFADPISLFAALDADGNGTVDMREFESFLLSMDSNLSEQKPPSSVSRDFIESLSKGYNEVDSLKNDPNLDREVLLAADKVIKRLEEDLRIEKEERQKAEEVSKELRGELDFRKDSVSPETHVQGMDVAQSDNTIALLIEENDELKGKIVANDLIVDAIERQRDIDLEALKKLHEDGMKEYQKKVKERDSTSEMLVFEKEENKKLLGDLELTNSRLTELERILHTKTDDHEARVQSLKEENEVANKKHQKIIQLQEETKERLESLSSEYFDISSKYLDQKILLESAKGKAAELETVSDDLRSQLASVKERVKFLENSSGNMKIENGALRSELFSLKSSFEKQTSRLETASVQMSEMENCILRYEDDAEAADLQVKALEAQVFTLGSQNEKLEVENASLSKDNDKFHTRLESAREQLNDFEALTIDYRDQVDNYEIEIAQLQTQVVKLSTDDRVDKNEFQSLMSKYRAQQERLENVAKDMNEMEASVYFYQEESETARNQLKEVEQQIGPLKKKNCDLEGEKETMSKTIESLLQEQTEMTARSVALKEAASKREEQLLVEVDTANEKVASLLGSIKEQEEKYELLTQTLRRDLNRCLQGNDEWARKADSLFANIQNLQEEKNHLSLLLQSSENVAGELKSELNASLSHIAFLETGQDAFLKELGQVKDELRTMKSNAELYDHEGRRFDSHQHKELEQLKSRIDFLESENKSLKANKEELVENVEKLVDQKEHFESLSVSQSMKIDSFKKEQDDLEDKIDAMKSDLLGCQSEIGSLTKQVESLNNSKASLTEANQEIENRCQDLAGAVESSNLRQDVLVRRLQNLIAGINEADSMKSELAAQLLSFEESLSESIGTRLSRLINDNPSEQSKNKDWGGNGPGHRGRRDPIDDSPMDHNEENGLVEIYLEDQALENKIDELVFILAVATDGLKHFLQARESSQEQVEGIAQDRERLSNENVELIQKMAILRDDADHKVQAVLEREDHLRTELERANNAKEALMVEKNTREELEASLVARTREVEDARWLNKDLAAQIESMQTNIEAVEKAKAKCEADVNELQTEVSKKHRALEDLSSDLADAKLRESKSREENVRLWSKLDSMTTSHDEKVKQLKNELEDTRKERDEMRTKSLALVQELSGVQNSKSKVDSGVGEKPEDSSVSEPVSTSRSLPFFDNLQSVGHDSHSNTERGIATAKEENNSRCFWPNANSAADNEEDLKTALANMSKAFEEACTREVDLKKELRLQEEKMSEKYSQLELEMEQEFYQHQKDLNAKFIKKEKEMEDYYARREKLMKEETSKRDGWMRKALTTSTRKLNVEKSSKGQMENEIKHLKSQLERLPRVIDEKNDLVTANKELQSCLESARKDYDAIKSDLDNVKKDAEKSTIKADKDRTEAMAKVLETASLNQALASRVEEVENKVRELLEEKQRLITRQDNLINEKKELTEAIAQIAQSYEETCVRETSLKSEWETKLAESKESLVKSWGKLAESESQREGLKMEIQNLRVELSKLQRGDIQGTSDSSNGQKNKIIESLLSNDMGQPGAEGELRKLKQLNNELMTRNQTLEIEKEALTTQVSQLSLEHAALECDLAILSGERDAFMSPDDDKVGALEKPKGVLEDSKDQERSLLSNPLLHDMASKLTKDLDIARERSLELQMETKKFVERDEQLKNDIRSFWGW